MIPFPKILSDKEGAPDRERASKFNFVEELRNIKVSIPLVQEI